MRSAHYTIFLFVLSVYFIAHIECATVKQGKSEVVRTAVPAKRTSTKPTIDEYDADDEDDDDFIDDDELEDANYDEYDEYEEEYYSKKEHGKQGKKNNAKLQTATKPPKPTNDKVQTSKIKGSPDGTEKLDSQNIKNIPKKTSKKPTSSIKSSPKASGKQSKGKVSNPELSDAESETSDGEGSGKLKNVVYIPEANNLACSLKLNQDISIKNEPLFLEKSNSGEYHLMVPNLVAKSTNRYDRGIGAIQFDKEESIYLACPGKDNKLQGSNNEDSAEKITCSDGTNVFTSFGNVQKLTKSSELTCSKAPEPWAKYNKENKPCGDINGENEGKLVELGFSAQGWQKLIDVCFDVKNIRTLYATHSLYGPVLAGAVVDSNRPNFNKGQDDFYKGNPLEYYKKLNQKEVIQDLTGSGKFYDSALLYLAKGHFAPDADFLFKSWQDATYFFVNAAPQWQCINQGHWLSVERLSRNIAMKLGEILSVATGPYGIMELPNRNGQKEKLYLKMPQKINSKKKQEEYPALAVPDRYWKIIHRPKKNECIVLTSTNNPFIDEPNEICTNICTKYNWPNLWDKKKGFVSCCTYDDFKRTVTYVPHYNCTGGVLVGP